ncbi:MAG: hypothetical protein U0525_03470 [Patescibacteria group bacterium]
MGSQKGLESGVSCDSNHAPTKYRVIGRDGLVYCSPVCGTIKMRVLRPPENTVLAGSTNTIELGDSDVVVADEVPPEVGKPKPRVKMAKHAVDVSLLRVCMSGSSVSCTDCPVGIYAAKHSITVGAEFPPNRLPKKRVSRVYRRAFDNT